MSLVFYLSPMSTATVTEAVIAELGLECERVQLDIDAGDTRKPGFLEINPNGRVPTIVHEGIAIWESAAITMYLGDLFGAEAGLYPASGPKRGEAMKWIAWASATLGEAAGRLSASLPPGTPGAVQSGSVDAVAGAVDGALARSDVMARLRVLDEALADRKFLAGDYTLADTHLFVLVGWVASMHPEAAQLPNLSAWLQRCGARPALSQVFES